MNFGRSRKARLCLASLGVSQDLHFICPPKFLVASIAIDVFIITQLDKRVLVLAS